MAAATPKKTQSKASPRKKLPKTKAATTNGSKRGKGGHQAKKKKENVAEDSGTDDLSDAPLTDKEEDDASLDSDALDEDSDVQRTNKKRKRAARSSPDKKLVKKKAKTVKTKQDEEEEEDEFDGLEIVGDIVQAPTEGRVPPGRISQNTLDFLKQLEDPECNDREWFKLHDPVFRQAEKEWKDFIEVFTPHLVEEDPEIPVLPPNDVVHRIYRDIRFSNDKTPYKTNFSASFSRTGRKGNFAHYHLCIKPGGSLLACGAWCPSKDMLQSLRTYISRKPSKLRDVIGAPEFEALFGKAVPHPKGERRNIFGGEDELKFAPKGVAKDHRDIDLLKCRSFAVVTKISDNEVLDPDFIEKIQSKVRVMRPFVHALNEMMTTEPESDDDEEEEDEGE